MKKIIFIDVDGTLVDYEGHLPESAVKAIRQARNNGHRVYICTGRSKAEVYPNLWDIGLDGMIGGNGSYVEDHGHVVLHQLITADQCRRIVDWLHSRKLEFYLESNNGLFASEQFAQKAQPVMVEYSRRKGKADADSTTVASAFPDMIYDGELYRDDLNKVSYILNSYQDFLDTKEQFPDMANAIEALLKHLGADREDTMAFGDAKIDIPMLEYCNVGIAMGSGGPEIKEMADYITDGVDEDGLYNAFVKFGLIEKE